MELKRIRLAPHPGELLQWLMWEWSISQNALAGAMGVSPRRVNEIVNGKRRITAETAILLGEVVGPDPRFWMVSQAEYDLEIEMRRQNYHPRRKRKLMAPEGPDAAFDQAEFEAEERAADLFSRRW